MKPDLSPDDVDGILLSAARRAEDARPKDRDEAGSPGLIVWLGAAVAIAFVIAAIKIARWSFAA